MKIENEKQLVEFMDVWEELTAKVAKIATAMLKLKGIHGQIDSEDVQIEDDMFYATYEEYSRCESYEIHTINVPNAYIFDDNFLENAKEELKLKEAERQKQKQKQREKNALKEYNRELAQYNKLKKKFG